MSVCALVYSVLTSGQPMELTSEVEGEGDEAVVLAEDTQRLLALHQREEVVRHRLAIKEVVHAQQEVPVRERARCQADVSNRLL